MRSTRRPKGGGAGVMALAIGIFVLGAPPRASATFLLALQEDAGSITTVASGPSFGPLSASGTFGDYAFSLFSATALDGVAGSNLLSAVARITSLVAATHTVSLYVSNQDYTLPTGSPLTVRSGMSGTFGLTGPGFTAGPAFQLWADAANGLLAIPGTFTNGFQLANPVGGTRTLGTGVDPSGTFTRSGPYSLTERTTIETTGLGDSNYSSHVIVAATAVPEPRATLIMFMVGLVALFIGARRGRPQSPDARILLQRIKEGCLPDWDRPATQEEAERMKRARAAPMDPSR